MWTVVYIAPNQACAESIRQVLIAEGLMVTLRPAGVPDYRNGGSVEILVPELEAEEAHEILASAVIV